MRHNKTLIMNAVVMGLNLFNANQIVIPENQALNIDILQVTAINSEELSQQTWNSAIIQDESENQTMNIAMFQSEVINSKELTQQTHNLPINRDLNFSMGLIENIEDLQFGENYDLNLLL